MSGQSLTLLITLVALAVVLLTCSFFIRRALKRGYISYSGNRPVMPVRTYSRKEVPLGFWAGIAVIVFVAVMAVLVASVFLLAAPGINVWRTVGISRKRVRTFPVGPGCPVPFSIIL